MAYIGNTLRTAQPNYQIIDDISASFNGSTTSFALQVGGVTPAPFPVSAQHCLISVGGVIQQPDPTGTDGFLLSGSNIVFSAAPSAGEDFFGVVLAGADYINVGAAFPDGSVATPSITFDQDTDTGLYRKGANSIGITTNGIERVNVGERVGIGVSSPSQLLHLSSTGFPTIRVTDADNSTFFDVTNSDGDIILKGDEGNSFANSAIRFNIDGAEKARIQSGGGISFNGDTAAANALDDYEEGTFIPSFVNGTFTYGNRAARYIKIGNQVAAHYLLSWTAKSGGGSLQVALPFVTGGTAQDRYCGTFGYLSGLYNDGNKQLVATTSGNGAPNAAVYIINNNAPPTGADVSNLSATGEFQLSIVYPV